ncbi:hypothetical protein DUE52_23980 [Larkinella punicea]|uniref:Uncharacterized protein n=1 Tax=Larkinella punicea TaxID=2315727 RepID=A0A368JKA3_9BACT|nr:hypothetical protein [Larkinella sp. C7]RCR67114.1 hypothetical protein DUE52_23980 [Larkinella punicea]
MAIITNLDPQRRVLAHGFLLVEEVSIDEEVWCAVEEYLEENGKDNELSFSSNFHISSEGKCIVYLSKKILV